MHLYGTIVSPTYFALGSIARLDKRIDLRTTVVESNLVYKKSSLLIQKATSKACIKMCQTISETMFEGARARYTRVVNAPCERCINICCWVFVCRQESLRGFGQKDFRNRYCTWIIDLYKKCRCPGHPREMRSRDFGRTWSQTYSYRISEFVFVVWCVEFDMIHINLIHRFLIPCTR